MRLGFLLKRGKDEALQLAAQLAPDLLRAGHRLVVPAEEGRTFAGAEAVPVEELGRAVDVLIVMGGDGTFLHGANLVADDGVPLLGINLGTLGFMTHYPRHEAAAAIEAACAGQLPIVERMRLRVAVLSSGGETDVRHALNEAVITQRSIARLIDLSAEFDGSGRTTYKADGLIVSTPTGSTAYNLAAGGPIMTPALEAIVVTPICPHALTNRPVVLDAKSRVVITNVTSVPVMLTTDGQWSRELAPGDAVEVMRAARPLRTFHPPRPFFAILREKLSWGERQT